MDRMVWAIASRDPALAFARTFHPKLDGAASIEAYARKVTEQLTAAGIERAAFVGHSMGALIALTIVQQRLLATTALVLTGAAARMPVNPALLEQAENDLPRAARMIAGFAIAPSQRRAAPATPAVSLAGAAVALLERSPPGRLASDLRACDDFAFEIQPALAPTLVVTGSADRMTSPRKGRELAGLLGAGLVEIADAGHMMMLERPQDFADAVVPFLRSIILTKT
jgi:pimeloyl-ACP methyl ester carboxylesterase